MVQNTGTPASSASSRSRSPAPARSTPAPAQITGRRAASSAPAAASTSSSAGRWRVATGERQARVSSGTGCAHTSEVSSTTTGPPGPLRSAWKARRITSTTWSGRYTGSTRLTTSRQARAAE